METRQALVVDAFAAEPTTGTRTGVVPDAGGLDGDQLRAIARELGPGVTAFLEGSGSDQRRLRFVSPRGDAATRTAATVATYGALFERGEVDDGSHAVGTERGSLDVTVRAEGDVWVDRPTAENRSADVAESEAADALGIDVASIRDVGADVPIGRTSAGRPVLAVPVNYFEHLSGAAPDASAVRDLCDREGCAAVYGFTFDTLDGGSTVHVRGFAPAPGSDGGDGASSGLREEPASGAAAGAVGAFLRRHGVLDGEEAELVVEQGHFLDRPGRVRVETDGESVSVGGGAVTAVDGRVTVPASGDDDIIEV